MTAFEKKAELKDHLAMIDELIKHSEVHKDEEDEEN